MYPHDCGAFTRQPDATMLTAVSLPCRTSKFGSFAQLIVGHHKGFPIKRILMQFDVSGGPKLAIESATLQLWFLYAHKASWMQEGTIASKLRQSYRMLLMCFGLAS